MMVGRSDSPEDKARNVSEPVTPFRIETSEAELEDLRTRLRWTRWPGRETVGDWSQGVPLGYLRELCQYWEQEYDWRARQRRLNARPAISPVPVRSRR